MKLDLAQTLGLLALVFWAGLFAKRWVRALDRLNLPAAVLGGFAFALGAWAARVRGVAIELDTTLQPILMGLFFSSIGFAARLRLIREGGAGTAIFLGISVLFCFAQNCLGLAIAALFGEAPLLGVLAGSVTLVGGPATGLAFAPLFEARGVAGAEGIALAAATFGIVAGGTIGAPISTWAAARMGRRASSTRADADSLAGDIAVRRAGAVDVPADPSAWALMDPDGEGSSLVLGILQLLFAIGAGTLVSRALTDAGAVLPGYIGAMIVAALLRNLADLAARPLESRAIEVVGGIALNAFLTLATMNLKLWELARLAVPLSAILLAQCAVVALFSALAIPRLMGRDYDAAVMAGGFAGFALGTTANAVANMRMVISKLGPAPRAFLIVPIVGAFLIDFANSIVITLFLN